MANPQNTHLPSYVGPSPLTGALGSYKINQLSAIVAGAVVGVALASVRGTSVLAEGYSGAVVGTAVGIPYGLWGAVKGWNEAKQAKESHDALLAENRALKQKLSWVERAVQSDTAPEQGMQRS